MRLMNAAGVAPGHHLLLPLRTFGRKPPLFCIHAGGGEIVGFRNVTAVMPEDQPVYGLCPPNMMDVRDFPTVEELAAMYIIDIRNIQAHGPYQLCGQSFGGLVA